MARAWPITQTAVNALLNGEIDMIESPPHDLLPLLAKDKNIKLFNANPLGNQYTFRFNILHKPFDNAKVRQAVLVRLQPEGLPRGRDRRSEVVQGLQGDVRLRHAAARPIKGMEDKLNSNFAKAKAASEGGRLRRHADRADAVDRPAVLTNLAPVAKALMEKGRLQGRHAVDGLADAGRRRAKKDPPDKGGWNAFLTSWVAADILNPVMAGFFNAGCDKAMFGWPCDETIEKLRDEFAKETDPAKQKADRRGRAEVRVDEYPTHVHLGQWYSPFALRTNVDGNIEAPVPVFWNVDEEVRQRDARGAPAPRAHRRGRTGIRLLRWEVNWRGSDEDQ